VALPLVSPRSSHGAGMVIHGKFVQEGGAVSVPNACPWEGVAMRKHVSISKKPNPTPSPYEGVYLYSLRYVEGEFYNYEDLPSVAVLVAKQGSALLDLCIDYYADLGWAELVKAYPPEDWEDSYDDYAYENDLPEFIGFALNGEAVRLITTRTRKRFLVVSESAWHSRWEEVKQYLLKHGYATTTEPELGEISITLGGDPEFEVICDGEVVPANSLFIFRDGDVYEPIGTDGASHTAELRPDAAYSPEEYVENFLALLEEVKEAEVLLSVQGDTYALGGHIHIGSSNDLVVQVLQDEVKNFVQVLDDFVGRVLLPTSGRARGSYARLGEYETKDYGWEYRTPPASFYADPEMIRIVYKLTKGLVEFLLREGEISYETLEGGRAKPEEYLRFLTQEEAEHFLAFPERWAKGEIIPFVPMEDIPQVLFTFRDEWDDDNAWVFKEALKYLPVKRPVKLVLYGLAQRRGDYFAIPTATEEWRLKEEFPKVPFVEGAIPEVWVGVPYRFRRVVEIPEALLEEFVSWVEEYLAQLKLLATQEVAE
jgi:hypothetical protein